MSAADKLRGMINEAKDQIDNLDAGLAQIDEIISEYTEEIDAVENGLCAVAQSDLTAYLEITKISEVEGLYGDPFNTPFLVKYGLNFGIIDYTTGGITDFRIVDSSGVTMYSYGGVNWDSDSTIIGLVNDYAFGNDYLTRPLTSGASYGLYPNRTNMNTAKSLLQQNRNKVNQSITTFENYAS